MYMPSPIFCKGANKGVLQSRAGMRRCLAGSLAKSLPHCKPSAIWLASAFFFSALVSSCKTRAADASQKTRCLSNLLFFFWATTCFKWPKTSSNTRFVSDNAPCCSSDISNTLASVTRQFPVTQISTDSWTNWVVVGEVNIVCNSADAGLSDIVFNVTEILPKQAVPLHNILGLRSNLVEDASKSIRQAYLEGQHIPCVLPGGRQCNIDEVLRPGHQHILCQKLVSSHTRSLSSMKSSPFTTAPNMYSQR